MKILLAHNNLHVTGGAEVFFLETGRVLSEHGHQVAYFCARDANTPASEWNSYFPEAVRYQSGSLVHKICNLPKAIYSREAKRNLARLLDDFRPDLVHAFAIYVKLTPSILDVCREKGVPVVLSCNDYKLICPNYKLFHHGQVCGDCRGGRYYKAISNRCAQNSLTYSVVSAMEAYTHAGLDVYRKNVHTFLFASAFMAHKTEEFWGKETFRWQLLRNPFDTQSCRFSTEDDGYLLYFGRLIEEKGVDRLLQAIAELPHIPLKIIGDGPDLEQLREFVQKKRLANVEFTGPMWGEPLNRCLGKARAVVVPSIWHENFPYVILQAFASGKPVIGSDRGGIPELVQHGRHGLTYSALDQAALKATLQELWSDPERCRTMGRQAYDYVTSQFNDQKFYSTLMQIYNDVIAPADNRNTHA